MINTMSLSHTAAGSTRSATVSRSAQLNYHKKSLEQLSCVKKIIHAACDQKMAKAVEKKLFSIVPKVQTALKQVDAAEWELAAAPLRKALHSFMSVREIAVENLQVPEEKVSHYVGLVCLDLIGFCLKLSAAVRPYLRANECSDLSFVSTMMANRKFVETALRMHTEMNVLEEMFERYLRTSAKPEAEKI